MANPVILTLLAKHHLVERDPIGSRVFFVFFLRHEGRQVGDFEKKISNCFLRSTCLNFPQNVFTSCFVVACRSSTCLGLLNRARKNVKKSKVVHTAISK